MRNMTMFDVRLENCGHDKRQHQLVQSTTRPRGRTPFPRSICARWPMSMSTDCATNCCSQLSCMSLLLAIFSQPPIRAISRLSSSTHGTFPFVMINTFFRPLPAGVARTSAMRATEGSVLMEPSAWRTPQCPCEVYSQRQTSAAM